MNEQDHILDDKIVTTYTEDVSAVLEQAAAERNAVLDCERFPKTRTFHRAAYIPATVVVEMMRRGVNFMNPDERDERIIREWMNGEFKKLKTVNARL